MPSVSARQHRAMEAAAHGHSTLGIPESVGKEFVAADASAFETEREAAEAVRDHRATSPLRYENAWLYALRVTGTGISYRVGRKEFVFRTPEVFLHDDFVQRCNGLPVILVHPEGTLDAEEFSNRAVGTIILPYREGDEVWGVARIFDDELVEEMRKGDLSTSPGVRFGKDEIATAQIDEDSLAIEGNPSLVDHLAIVPAGVWDKGGAPSGVRNDAVASAASDSDATGPCSAADRKDDEMADDPSKALMDKLDEMCGRLDALGSRMDSMEKDRKDAAEREEKDRKDGEKDRKDGEKSRKDASKKDAEDEREEAEGKTEEKTEEKEKEEQRKDGKEEREEKDAAVQAVNDALAAQIAAMQAKIDALTKPQSYEDMESLSRAQTRADGVLQMLGERPERPLPGESSKTYRKRILAKIKKHSASLKDISVDALDGVILDQIEERIYADAQVAARTPSAMRPGVLIPVTETDAAGRRITKYYGDSKAWRSMFDAPPIACSMPRPQGGIN